MRRVSVWLAAAAMAFAIDAAAQGTHATATSPLPDPNPNAPGSGKDAFVPEPSARTFTVTGTVVRERGGEMVVRIDDHGHRIPFQVAPGAAQDVAPGSRVSVTYHPTGATGQTAEQVQVLQAPHNARSRRGDDGKTAR